MKLARLPRHRISEVESQDVLAHGGRKEGLPERQSDAQTDDDLVKEQSGRHPAYELLSHRAANEIHELMEMLVFVLESGMSRWPDATRGIATRVSELAYVTQASPGDGGRSLSEIRKILFGPAMAAQYASEGDEAC